MPKRVEVPGYGVIEFPDTMSDDKIAETIKTQVLTPQKPAEPQAPTPASAPSRPSSTIDPMTGIALPTTPEATESYFSGISEGAAPVSKIGLAQAIGMGGPALGAVAGTAALGPAGGIAGELAGSFGARKLNVALGLEEPGMVGDVASVGVPAALRAVGPIARRLPGVSAVLHERGAAQLDALPGAIRPPSPSGPMYERISQVNPSIPTKNLQNQITSTLSHEATKADRLQNTELKGIAESIKEQIDTYGDKLPFQNLWADLKAVGEKIGKARAEGGEGYGALRQFYKAIFDDMDAAASSVGGQTNAAVQALKVANRSARREFAAGDFAEIINRNINRARQGDALVSVNGSSMLKAFQKELRNDDLFMGSFTQPEIDMIENTFKRMAVMPQLPPARGAMAGSMKALGTGGLATAGATLLGAGPQMSSVAGGIGVALPWLIGTALTTSTGRKVVGALLGRQALFTPQGVAALTGFLRTSAQLSGEAATSEIPQ